MRQPHNSYPQSGQYIHMSTVSTQTSRSSPGFLPVLVASLGVVLMGYGALVLAASPLGGAWLAITGLCLFLSGAIATDWVAERFDLSAGQRRTLSLGFGAVGVVLLLLFVVVNYAVFTAFETVEVRG